MANHGPRLRRLMAPSVKSRSAMLANAIQGAIALGLGGCVGGPVDVRTAAEVVDADGASASTLGVGDGVALGAGVARFGAGPMCVALAAVDGAGAPQIEANAAMPGAWFAPTA